MSEFLRITDDPSKGGVKKDEGKLRWSLLPWDALEEVVKVLMFGADKYTFKYENKWEALFRVSNATKLEFTLKDFVAVAMKDNSGKITLSLHNAKEKIDKDGQPSTRNELKSWNELEELILLKEKEIAEPTDLITYDVSDLTKSLICLKAATSVASENICTLTMTIPRENFAESFVVNTTTVSDSWETMWLALKQHSIISKGADHRELSGNRNWEKGMEFGRLFDAGLRHKIAWWQKGEAKAEDSKIHHLAHEACDTLFLLAYELRNVGTDDRPTSI